jgi:sugar phosphate isomerase/epimerase
MNPLCGLAVAVFSTALCVLPSMAQEPKPVAPSAAEKLGWRVGVHSYTFRLFSIFDAIDKAQALGVKYMSVSGSVSLDGKDRIKTTDLSPESMAAIQQKLAAAGIKLLNMGVVQLPADEKQSRAVFEFARKMGIGMLVAEPEPDALDTVEKLCREFNIRVAIHNHPKPSRYWNPDTVLAALEGRSPLLGACADTGHWIRSGINPVEAVKKLEGRILCFHFKDLNERSPQAHDVPWGNGVGDIKGVLTEMKRQKFHGDFLVEYEHNWENSSPEIAQGLKYFEAVCSELSTP